MTLLWSRPARASRRVRFASSHLPIHATYQYGSWRLTHAQAQGLHLECKVRGLFRAIAWCSQSYEVKDLTLSGRTCCQAPSACTTALAIMLQDMNSYCRRKICVVPCPGYFFDELGESRLALLRNLLQSAPKLVFKADARLVAPDQHRSFNDVRSRSHCRHYSLSALKVPFCVVLNGRFQAGALVAVSSVLS